MKQFSVLIAVILLVTVPVMADGKSEVEILLKNRLGTVISVLRDKALDEDGRTTELIKTVEPMFDFLLMAKLVLGKSFWKSLNSDQQKIYTDLFVTKLKYSYISKLKLYTDETVVIKDTEIKGNGKVHVATDLMSGGNAYSMLYKFYNKKGQWKIYDIEIQGVSIISSYRSQCKHILSNGTFDELIEILQKPDNG